MPNADWMSRLPDGRNLTRLAIPGTHDSGACEYSYTPMTRAQNLSIPDQLLAGVRALDIRCAATWGSIFSTTYNVFHGPIDQGISIETVMTNVVDFLNAHTDEVVLVMLKQEGGKNDISADINDIVNDTLGVKLYARTHLMQRWPTLGECRGRALVLSRLQNPDASHFSTVGWPDNPTSAEVACTAHYGVKIQDLYKSPEVKDKKKAVSNFLLDARFAAQRANNETQLFLNFTSFVWKPWEPVWSGSTHMTPYLLTRPGGAGVVCVDAVTEELASHIISLNR